MDNIISSFHATQRMSRQEKNMRQLLFVYYNLRKTHYRIEQGSNICIQKNKKREKDNSILNTERIEIETKMFITVHYKAGKRE